MSGESKPMSIAVERAADRLRPELKPGGLTPSGAIVWAQRGLLTLLVMGHYLLPILFGEGSDLLRDGALLAQASILLVLVTLGGLRIWSTITLVLLFPVPAIVWYLSYPAYLREYLGTWLLPFVVSCLLTVGSMRLYGFRGTWREATGCESKPLQLSIRTLLLVTTIVAAFITAANWLHILAESGLDRDYRLWIDVSVGGAVAAFMTALVAWGVGRRGSLILRWLVLVTALLFLAACEIYALQMEGYWQLPTMMIGCWTIVTVGTLAVWRACGWHVVVRNRDGSYS